MNEYMKRDFSLLEYLADQARCEYLSDLKGLSDWERIKLGQILERVPEEAATLFEWNDVLAYLAGAPPEQTQAAARVRLIEWLSQPRKMDQTSIV